MIGDYRLPMPLTPGERFAFLDQAHYSMVKTTTFNGVPLPSIWLWDSETDPLELVRKFGYEDFRDRLSRGGDLNFFVPSFRSSPPRGLDPFSILESLSDLRGYTLTTIPSFPPGRPHCLFYFHLIASVVHRHPPIGHHDDFPTIRTTR